MFKYDGRIVLSGTFAVGETEEEAKKKMEAILSVLFQLGAEVIDSEVNLIKS
jgi:hypothetical protein